jgi:hypothetical protein
MPDQPENKSMFPWLPTFSVVKGAAKAGFIAFIIYGIFLLVLGGAVGLLLFGLGQVF